MLLGIVGIPVVFTMAVWVVVTSIRIWHPEREMPIEQSAERLHRLRLHSNAPLRVRFEDIRALEREHHVAAGLYEGLEERRN